MFRIKGSLRRKRKDRHSKVGFRHGEKPRFFSSKEFCTLMLHFKMAARLGEIYYAKFPDKRPPKGRTSGYQKVIGHYRDERGTWQEIFDDYEI